MSNSPDDIRAGIEATRSELSYDVDALADKVTPSKIAHRKTEELRGRMGAMRDRVMGAASDAKDVAADAAGDMRGAAQRAGDKAQGNPLAVGLIAFGVGWLAASLMPTSSKEKELAATAREKAEPLMDDMKEQAKESAEHLKQPATDAAQAVKESATDAAQEVRGEAQGAASDLQEHARQSGDELRQ
jgi:hypothetical protein